ncbi:tetraspanin-19-like [Iris pallida]|uniref:Tetraspanin-19-like n=1 Tax=Iris pallida TaxID=29817 RepID=A0AAX6HCJ3_IRIPA|nr:tetraspanin-19-like [Iris pallida]
METGGGGRWVRVWLQALLKLVNCVIGLVGTGLILYSLWLIRVWYKDGLQTTGSPWFMYTILSLGASFCLVTCFGHVAAETTNGHCLSCYMIFLFSIVILEAGITVLIFLNRNWEEDFPDDPSGRFNELKDFVSSNFEICKWIGLSFAAAQAIALIIALILRVIGPERVINYDSDDDYVPARLPLLRNQAQHISNITDPSVFLKNESQSVRIS